MPVCYVIHRLVLAMVNSCTKSEVLTLDRATQNLEMNLEMGIDGAVQVTGNGTINRIT